MGHVVDFSHLEDLADKLEAAGIRQASTVPEELNLPGVWIQVDPVTGIELDHLAAYTINLVLHVITPELDHRRAMKALTVDLARVTSVIDPTGPIRPETVALPQHTQPMPALAVPAELVVE